MRKKKIPNIRFPEFTDEWEEKPLSDFFIQSKLKNKELEFDKTEVLSVTAEKGLVNQIEYHGRSYAGVSVAPYGIIRKGEMVYTKSPLKKYPYGIIKLNDYTDGIISTLYAIYTLTKQAYGKFFDFYFYHDYRINKYLKPLVNIGAKNDMKVNNDHAISDPVIIPSFLEQKKISQFLTTIDIRLKQLRKKKRLLKQFKKGLMQKIFSHEIRFKDKNGDVFPEGEYVSLESIATRVKRKNAENNQNVLTISAQYGLISQLDYFNKSVSAKDITGYYLLEKGEFAYNKSYSNGYPYGAFKKLNKYDKGAVSTLYICFKIEKGNSNFFEQYFESGLMNKGIHQIATEGARNHGLLNVGIDDFFQLKVYFPCLEEQKKIADFLTAIDDKISLVEQQIEKTEAYKKGLLQQMFV